MAAKAKATKRTTGKGIAQRVQMVIDRLDRLSKVERITPDQLSKVEEALGLKMQETIAALTAALTSQKKPRFVFDDEAQLDELRSAGK